MADDKEITPEEIQEQVKNITLLINSFRSLYSFVRKHAFATVITTLLGVGAGGGGMYGWYSTFIEPKMKGFVVDVTREYAGDSLKYYVIPIIDTAFSKKGISMKFEQFVDTINTFHDQRKVDKARISYLEKQVLAMRSVGILIVNETFSDTIADGYHLKKAPSGDLYALDSLSIPWGASPKNMLNGIRGKFWVYYPPYNNNEMVECRKFHTFDSN